MGIDVELSYDRTENIVFMAFPSPVELSTRRDILAHFERVIAFWRANAGGRKAYFVVDFDNITIEPAELEYYAEQSKRAHDLCAIASVRYGGNHLQRTTARLAGIKNQRPSNIHETREQALAAVRAMKAREASVQAGAVKD